MFKRVLAFALVPLLLICTSGGIVYIEHCPMSNTPSYSLSPDQSCCCSKEFHEKCCTQNIVVIEKIQDHFYACTSQNILQHQHICIPALIPHRVQAIEFMPLLHLFSRDHDPPEPPVILPVLYRSLLI